jgi:hypothetical protein
MALRIAPSTLGPTQKSPQITSFVLSSQTHLSSPPIAMDGKAPPLQFYTLLPARRDTYLIIVKDNNPVRHGQETDHLWAFIKIGCGMFNPEDWNSLNNSSATLASASAKGFLGPISFITLDAYSAVECNTQDCLNAKKERLY